tara:strand:+ start:243 stop:431 length:189 start_codon:yes stop_codon:yes gene_type:complete
MMSERADSGHSLHERTMMSKLIKADVPERTDIPMEAQALELLCSRTLRTIAARAELLAAGAI